MVPFGRLSPFDRAKSIVHAGSVLCDYWVRICVNGRPRGTCRGSSPTAPAPRHQAQTASTVANWPPRSPMPPWRGRTCIRAACSTPVGLGSRGLVRHSCRRFFAKRLWGPQWTEICSHQSCDAASPPVRHRCGMSRTEYPGLTLASTGIGGRAAFHSSHAVHMAARRPGCRSARLARSRASSERLNR